MRVADLPVPSTAAARGALEVATEYCTPALLNHSLRSYVWAAAHAHACHLQLDHELLYVAALLHDIGLVAEFDNHSLAFEDAGGHIASVLTAGAGWDITRRARARKIIVEHMRPNNPTPTRNLACYGWQRVTRSRVRHSPWTPVSVLRYSTDTHAWTLPPSSRPTYVIRPAESPAALLHTPSLMTS